MLAKVSFRLLVIVIGASAIALLTYNYLSSLQETKTVVVSSTAIPEQTIITKEMLKTVTVEANSVDLLLKNPIDDPSIVVGAITRKAIKEGEPIKMDPELLVYPEEQRRYVTKDGKVNLDKFIPNEKRLFTLGLIPEESVDNRLKKGDFVDVILTGEIPDEAQGEEVFSRMILQYIEVYDVEKFGENQVSGLAKEGLVQHVTLIVSPQEAVALATAREQGNISLALNPSDGEPMDVRMIYESTFQY